MHLLRVIHSMKTSGGGPAESVRQFSRQLETMNVSTEVVTLDAPSAEFTKCEPGIERIWCLGPGRGSYGYSAELVPWIIREAGRFDAVIIQGLWNYHSFATWRALRRLRQTGRRCPPYWVYTHGMLDPWFKSAFPLKHLKKALYWRVVEQRVLRDAEGVLFTADEERLLARNVFRPYQCNEIVVAHGIEAPFGQFASQRDTFLNRWPALRAKRILLFLERLHPKKGPELVIEGFTQALAILPQNKRTEWALVMAGPVAGTDVNLGYVKSLESLAHVHLGEVGLGADSVLFTGPLQGDMKWGAFHGCEAFILPSHQENFGIAVVEALACGKPVLISNKVNIWREIEQDGAAMVEDDSLEGARSLIRRWMALSDSERATMGRNARRCFEERFEIAAAAELLAETLTEKS
jgi:glycosyltransferase involved in cell wall biosynthesis